MAQPTVPSVTDLYNSFIDDYVARSNSKTPLLRAAFVRVLAWPFAGLVALLYRMGQQVYFDMFLDTCSFSALRKHGERVDIFWQDGTPTVAEITLTGVTALSIPAGTLFTSPNGTVFQVNATTAVISNTAVCSATSSSTGSATNVSFGDKMSTAVALAGVPNAGTVTGVSEEGEDPQAVEDYRAEVRARYRLRPQGGAFSDYWLWTTTVDGIVDALIYVIRPGIVNVYPVAAGTGAARIPSSVKLAEVEEALRKSPDSDVYDRHPVQSLLNVLAPSTAEYTVRVSALDFSANTAQNRADIKAAVAAYMDSRRPQIPALGYTAAGGTVTSSEVTTEIIKILANSQNPGTFTSVDIELGGSSIGTKSVLSVGTLAKLGSIYINGVSV